MLLRSGDRIGPYTLERKLGSGRSGVVWLAAESTPLFNRPVALKLPILDVDMAAVRREAQNWAHLGVHPNLVTIYTANLIDDQVFIASEYVPGGTLADRLEAKEGAPESTEDAILIALGILSGLEHLHGLKPAPLIHRDLKPSNILMNGNVPRITDFGIARLVQADSNEHTKVAGSPAYMPAEAFDGNQPLTVGIDLWSAAVIIYRLLSGRLPYPQATMEELYSALKLAPLPPLPPSVPRPLQQFVIRALDKNPARRFQSAAEMRAALEAVRAEIAQSAGGGDSESRRREEEGRKRETLIKRAGMGAAALLLGALLFAVFHSWFRSPLEEGIALYRTGHYAEAERLFRKAIADNPKDAAAYNRLADVLTDIKNDDAEAIRTLQKALEVNPNDLEAYANLGILAVTKDHDYAKAEGYYANIVARMPNSAPAFWNLGNLCSVTGKSTEEALRMYRNALQVDPLWAPAYVGIGRQLYKQDKYAEAKSNAEKCLKINPNWSSAYILLGDIADATNDSAAAETAYKRASELDPLSQAGFIREGDLLRNTRHDLDQAEAWYEKARAADPKGSSAYERLGLCARDRKNDTRAIELFNQAIATDPHDAYAKVDLGDVYRDQKEYDKAEQSYQEAIKADVRYEQGYVRLGNLYRFQRSDLPRAEQAYRDAIREIPAANRARCQLGFALNAESETAIEPQKSARLDEAKGLFEEAMKGAPAMGDAYRGLGDVALAKGDTDGAEKAYSDGIAHAPDSDALYSVMGYLYFKKRNNPTEARKWYLKALDKSPTRLSYLLDLGFIDEETSQYASAEEWCRKAIKLEPDNGEAHAFLAEAIYRQNRYFEARTEADTAWRLGCRGHRVFKLLPPPSTTTPAPKPYTNPFAH
jgi:tetratricopeptide (TPR) repeat protein